MNKKMMIIDAHSLLYKAFYAVRPMHTSDNTPTNAVYGFVNMLIKLINDYAPDYCCAAFDAGKTTFRTEIFSEYKGGRQPMPEELRIQVPIVFELLQKANVTALSCENYEADDIIGEATRIAAENDMTAYIVTGDRDAFQLIDENTTVIYAKRGVSDIVYADEAYIRSEYAIAPKQFIDIKALMGDKSDNIPGVEGIGEKTAFALIAQYGSLDGIYAHIADIPGKLGEKLAANRETAYMSRSLGEILRETPLCLDFEMYKHFDFQNDAVIDLLTRLEMKSILRLLGLSNEPKNQTYEEITVLREALAAEAYVGKTVFFQLAPDASYLCINDGEETRLIAHPDAAYLRSFCEDGRIEKITHDLKPVYKYLLAQNIAPRGFVFDTYIAAYLIDPSAERYSLGYLSKKYLDVEIQTAARSEQLSLFESGGMIDEHLAAQETSAIGALHGVFVKKIEDDGMQSLYFDIEHKLIRVLAEMELEGFGIDVSVLEEIGREFDARNEELTRAILAYAPEDMQININSTRQLGELLFDVLGLPPVKKTKTGYSTDIEVLEKLKNQHPILPLLIEQRKLAKINSTYVKGLTKIVAEDRKIHSSFNQTITTTGRISSSNPNLQNIPVKTEEGRQIRKAFVPVSADNVLVSADYSQIELRVLAHITKDPHMTQAFQSNQDIHTITASEVFNVAPEDVTPLQRSQAKAVNFGIIYGISDFGLSRNLDISRKAAGEFIARYLEEFSGVKEYMAKIIAHARECGYVSTLFGRRRYLPDIYSANYTVRSFAERTALNTPIQGTAADIIKIAMINVADKLKEGGYVSKLTLQVHDELILDCPQREAEDVSTMLKYEMEHAAVLDVPLVANVAAGRDWYNAK